MSTVNPLAREIAAKIVFYGPGLSGKTTSLKKIFDLVRPERRGQLISLATSGDRTLFFDFLPIHIEMVGHLAVRLHLYTVPGQVFYDATRKHVLNGADGVVFVADSQLAARDGNLESMQNLAENLLGLGLDIAKVPLVLQYNKRDVAKPMPVATMRAELNKTGAPDFETVANTGLGVVPALKAITRLVVTELSGRQKQRRTKREGDPFDEITSNSLAASLSAAAADKSSEVGRVELSFAPLAGSGREGIVKVEQEIIAGHFGPAALLAVTCLLELLNGLPIADLPPAVKATLLGIDGRDYLRLCRIAGRPDAVVTHEDALLALHILVDAHRKAAVL